MQDLLSDSDLGQQALVAYVGMWGGQGSQTGVVNEPHRSQRKMQHVLRCANGDV